jgi:hypothetical protein
MDSKLAVWSQKGKQVGRSVSAATRVSGVHWRSANIPPLRCAQLRRLRAPRAVRKSMQPSRFGFSGHDVVRRLAKSSCAQWGLDGKCDDHMQPKLSAAERFAMLRG